jgi:transcriptional regulator with XRE-family HTH domain
MESLNELDRIRRNIGGLLREMRESRGLEQFDLARELDMSQSKISRIENGRLTPTVDDAKAMLRALKAKKQDRESILDDLEQLHVDLKSYRSLHGRGRRNVQKAISEREQDASLVRVLGHTMVPGLLQSAAYAKAIISTKPTFHTPETIVEYTQARLARQQVLFDESKQFHFVVLEAALLLRYAKPNVMAGQMQHLASMLSLPNVRLDIVPLSASIEVIPFSCFTIYDDNFVSVETPTAQVTVQDSPDIDLYVQMFDLLSAQAVSDGDARSLLMELMEEF